MNKPGTVWLDTARADAENRHSLYFTHPHEVLVARDVSEVERVLEQAQQARDAGMWIAGFLAYEAAGVWLPHSKRATAGPLVWFGVYDAPGPVPERQGQPVRVEGLHVSLGAQAHAAGVESIRAWIKEGDVYQVNYTFALSATLHGSAASLYQRLRQQQPVPYGAYIETPEMAVASLSPELFFRVEGQRIWSRPMKGTLPRGRTQIEDVRMGRSLQQDPKNRAENLMIVDLLRNDLSRITVPGSVRVPHLYQIEQHPTLFQMTSTVEGLLQPGLKLPEMLRALFPCGSVTGAPKERAMQRIHELEAAPRGVYCGAIGYAAPHDEMAFSVPIRTVEVRGGEISAGIGSGIVWDSRPESEYRECLLKARFLTDIAVSR